MTARVARPVSEWTVLTSTSLAVVAVFLDTSILFVAFPSISASFSDVSTTTMSWVLNAYTIVFAALLIPAGRLADRVGRRKTFLTAVVIFTVASVLCGLAPTVGLLILGRILQAVGAAALVPSSLALVLQTFPRPKIPMAVAIWGSIGAVAGAAGPTIGALVVENFGWRWAFFINVPVGIVSFVMGRRVLPEGREAHPGRLPDPLGVVLLASGLALLAYAIVKTADWGWTSAEFVGGTVLALALLAAFIHRCRVVSNPLLELTLFRVRNFRWANAAAFVFAIGFNAMFLGNILFFTMVWHFSILESGLAIGRRATHRGAHRSVVRKARRTHRTEGAARSGRTRLCHGRSAAPCADGNDAELRHGVPPRSPLHGAGRRAVPSTALVRSRARTPARPLRRRLGNHPGGPKPRWDDRCCHRDRFRGRRGPGDSSRTSAESGGCWSLCGVTISLLSTQLTPGAADCRARRPRHGRRLRQVPARRPRQSPVLLS